MNTEINKSIEKLRTRSKALFDKKIIDRNTYKLVSADFDTFIEGIMIELKVPKNPSEKDMIAVRNKVISRLPPFKAQIKSKYEESINDDVLNILGDLLLYTSRLTEKKSKLIIKITPSKQLLLNHKVLLAQVVKNAVVTWKLRQ